MLTSSIADFKTSPYVIPRDALDACLQQIRKGTPLQVVHSNLGNGKTIFAESLCVRAAEMGWRCFKLDRERPRLSEEINYFLRSLDNTLLIVEHYPTHFDMLRALFAVKNTNVSVVLTARTPAHEIFSDRLAEITKEPTIVEHDLNRLSDNEIGSLNSLLNAAGYWHNLTGTGPRNGSRLVRRKYHRELQAVLLGLIESPAIRDRVQAAYDELCKVPHLELFVVTGFILDGIGFGKDAFLLAELVDRPTSLPDLMRRSAVAREFVIYRDGEFASRSPILARFVLTNLETSGSVEAALLGLFRMAASLRTASSEIDNLSIQLMQYSQIESLFPRKNKTTLLSNYYEGIKNLIPLERLHHYWLRYAISPIATDDYEKTEVFLDSAHRIARENGRNSYYIDNHRARFLLKRCLHRGDAPSSAGAFRQAHRILIAQMKRKETRYYPYKVAQLYGELGDRFFDDWRTDDQLYFTGSCKAVLKAIGASPESLRRNRSVQDCAEIVSAFLDSL